MRPGFTIPQHIFLYAVTLGGLLSGGALVHAVLKPDLTLPLPPAKPLK